MFNDDEIPDDPREIEGDYLRDQIIDRELEKQYESKITTPCPYYNYHR